MKCRNRMFLILISSTLLIIILPSKQGYSEPFGGYTLFNPVMQTPTYLIDEDNKTVYTWDNSRRGGYSVYLLENGHLLRPASADNPQLNGGGAAGLVQDIDPDGNVVWEFEYNSSTYLTHHDIEPMPNGNVLLIAWEVKSASEAMEAGLSQNKVIWPDHIIEVEPTGSRGGNIVWEWHAWDHLIQDYDPSKENYGVISEHPELIDINTYDGGGPQGGDWMHINGVSYNPELDQIVISSHFLDEFYVIDHSTTTEEAAGHTGGNSGKGGDILYRWGNPENYDTQGEHYFDVIHCSWWVPKGLPGEGNILVFNNGSMQHESEIVEITPPIDDDGNYIINPGQPFGPSVPTWTYSDGSNFYSNHLGSCQRLPNGNTFICEATSGFLFEVDSNGKSVWDYSHGGQIARAMRYSSDYKGLQYLGITKTVHEVFSEKMISLRNYPNPFSIETTIHFNNPKRNAQVKIFSINGKVLLSKTVKQDQFKWNAKNQPSGIYIVKVKIGEQVLRKHINVIK